MKSDEREIEGYGTGYLRLLEWANKPLLDTIRHEIRTGDAWNTAPRRRRQGRKARPAPLYKATEKVPAY